MSADERRSITRGDAGTIDVAIADIPDTIDLDEAQAITFTAKRSYSDADEDAIIHRDLADGVSVDEDGIHVELEAGDTTDLGAPMVLLWDVEVVEFDGKPRTVASGTLTVTPDVTRDSPIGS